MKKRNAARREREWDRAYGGEDRLHFVHSLPCCITDTSPVECVHVKGGGASRKADAKWIVPMAPLLHRELHRIGIRSFEAKYDVDLAWIAARIEEMWQAHVLMTTKDEPLCVMCRASYADAPGILCASCAYQPPRDAA